MKKYRQLLVIASLFWILSLNPYLFSLNYSETDVLDQKHPSIESINEIYAAQGILESRTEETKQLVYDPNIDTETLNPWLNQIGGDLDDSETNFLSNQLEYRLIGDERIFQENDPLHTDPWTVIQNPAFPAYPKWPYLESDHYTSYQEEDYFDSHVIDEDGAWTNHSWYESPVQTPSVNWNQTYTMPVDMSDYIITSADISGVVNGSAIATGSWNSGNIEVAGDTVSGEQATQHVTYDYAKFYINVADLTRNTEYTIASYQTTELGLHNTTDTITDIEENLIAVAEENIIFYLTSVLGKDNFHFQLILGIDIYCEDSFSSDIDIWNKLLIKNIDFSFTYRKRMDQFNTINWYQTVSKINESEYIDKEIEIDAASVNFQYNLSDSWPTDSPNSEIRVYLNNSLHSESINLAEEASTTPIFINEGDGFNIKNLLTDPNAEYILKMQLYIADEFYLNENISLTIDKVTLDVNYTVIERGDPIDTSLQPVDSWSKNVYWNDSFNLIFNYTEIESGVGINDTNFEITWLDRNDTFNFVELGNGLYQVDANASDTIANQKYYIKIKAPAEGLYLSRSITIEINVKPRLSYLDLYINDDLMGEAPTYELLFGENLNLTVQYYDQEGSVPLVDGEGILAGGSINSSYYSYDSIGNQYEFLVDTELLGLGTHLIGIYVEKDNYQTGYIQVRINIYDRGTYIQLYINSDELTVSPAYQVTFGDALNLTGFFFDEDGDIPINTAQASLEGDDFNSSYYNSSIDGNQYEFLVNTEMLGLGTHLLSLFIEKENYETSSIQIRINVVSRTTHLLIQANQQNVSINEEFTIHYGTPFSLNAFFYDSKTESFVKDAEISIGGINADSYQIETSDINYTIQFNTHILNLGRHYITIFAEKPNFEGTSFLFKLNIEPRPTRFEIMHNETMITSQTTIAVPILTDGVIEIGFFDNLTQAPLSPTLISLTGLNTSLYTTTYEDAYLQIWLDYEQLGLGLHTLSFVGENANYSDAIRTKQINVRQMQTRISTTHQNRTYSVKPGDTFRLQIELEDLDFGIGLDNCTVRYNWEYGSGQLTDMGNGLYETNLPDVPEGVYTIYITIFKGSYYDFEEFSITLNSVEVTEQNIPTWSLYTLGSAFGIVSASFIAYQAYFKYPKAVRKLHKVKRNIKRGKPTKASAFRTEKDLLKENYFEQIKKQGILKFPPGIQEELGKTKPKAGTTKKTAKHLTPSDEIMNK